MRDSDGHLVAHGGAYYIKSQEIEGAAIVGNIEWVCHKEQVSHCLEL